MREGHAGDIACKYSGDATRCSSFANDKKGFFEGMADFLKHRGLGNVCLSGKLIHNNSFCKIVWYSPPANYTIKMKTKQNKQKNKYTHVKIKFEFEIRIKL